MATIEDVLEAVNRLVERMDAQDGRLGALEAGQRGLHAEQQAMRADQQAMRADQRSLRTALEDQGRELRHHFDHALAVAVGSLRESSGHRFDALEMDLRVLTSMVTRLESGERNRREIEHGLLEGLQLLRQRVDRVEKRLGDGPQPPAPPSGPATSPPPAR